MIEYTNSAMREAIEECIHNDLYREIMRLRLIDGWTYERIAEAVDRTPRHICTIMSQNESSVFGYLRENSRKTS